MISMTDYYPANDGTATTVEVRNMHRQVVTETFDVPFEKFRQGVIAYNEGALIQNAFLFLNAEQREFMMTGMTFEEQREFFREDYEEDDTEASFD